MEKLFLIDAYAQIFRAYYAFAGRPMRNRQGLNTSPIFGFTKFLRDILINERPHYLGVAFDSGGVTTGPMTVPFILALGVGVSNIRSYKLYTGAFELE